ncbi:MAG: Trehalose/maltose import ATP-binding protein MalK [Methanocella sp. PtaU1.Bin125]|nr:MAG: Trehalose/maltose import ATP-binding protein MalK [Methanocella sp. PtaU1.Bin125]
MIETKNLSRSFGKTSVVRDLSLSVKAGEVFGFLGPNGAGKTTTVRMLTCLIEPSGGTALVDGLDVSKPKEAMQIRSRVGLLTETPGMYDTLSAYKNLRFYGRLYDVEEPRLGSQIEHYLKLLGLWQKKDEPVGSFSKGMRQKMAIARSLLHDPKVLFLDEPTSGLDPEAARLVRDFILELKKEGHTIFICTHNLDEADRLCDRIGIFSGRLLSVDAPSRLKGELYGRQIKIQLRKASAAAAEAVRALPFVRNVEQFDSTLTLNVNSPEQDNPELVRALVRAGADVQFITESSRSLEEVYFKVMGESR